MKKLEKLKNKKPERFYLKNTDDLESLKNNKYLIFIYREDTSHFWKFVKTEKILKIERVDNYYKIITNVNGNTYLTDGEFYTTDEFTIAKMTCDKNNKEN